MAGPVLVPALVSLRNEFDQLAPGRDKTTDGWIGDRAHRQRSSDHNGDESGATPYEDSDNVDEVHALDVDGTGPWPDRLPFGLLVDEIVKRHRLGLDDRLQNVIHNGRIASRSWGWTWRAYGGSNAHTGFAHFGCRYTSAHANNTKSWGLIARFRKDDTMTNEQIQQLADAIAKAVMDSAVKVGEEPWKFSTAIGYIARKAYEIDRTLDTATADPEPADPAPAAKPAAKPAGGAAKTSTGK